MQQILIMKKYFSVLFIIMISGNLYSSGNGSVLNDDPKLRMNKLRNEVFLNLTQNILPFWSDRMVDYNNGGFFGRINADNKVFPDEEKGGILNARILWTYSSAYRILKDTACLRLATRSKDYIMSHFIDRVNGGAYRSVKSDGEPSDTRKQVYTQSFFIYGLTEYYRATGDKDALKEAINIFELFEKFALDKESDGYFEVFTRDWHRTRDLLIGESGKNDEKTMNTHLHIMEAYSNLYRVWPDKRVAVRLKDLIQIFLDKIIDRESSHLICFMDKNWKSTSSTDSYGHDIESSWLLVEAAALIKDPDLTANVRAASIKIANAAAEGLQTDGSLIYERDHSNGRTNKERSWWAQAETVIGFLNAYEMTGNEKYLNNSLNCWNYIKAHFVDYKSGGWLSSVSESGDPGRGDKAGFWVCPYHNGRMCIEIIERVSSY
jgi:mannobiose 2-epimerase